MNRVSEVFAVVAVLVSALLAVAAPAAPAEAQEAAAEPSAEPAPPLEPALFHTPPTDAETDRPVVLEAELRGSWETADVAAYWRRPGGAWQAAPFRRALAGGYRAEVPEAAAAWPGFEYYIASRLHDGSEVLHFASPAAPHQVAVLRDAADQRYERRLQHHAGRIHTVTTEARAVWFGERSATVTLEGADPTERRFHDHYWNVEGRYTYRFLGPVYSITFGAGSLRGEGEEFGWRAPGARIDSPGLDYGLAGVRFAALDWLSAEVFGRLGADEEGFSGGVGGLVTVGLPAGTHLDLGGEWTHQVGFRAFLEFAWDTVPYCVMSLRSELSDWPDASRVGSISTFNTKVRVHPLVELQLSLGFAARHAVAEAGVTGGLGVGLHF